MATPTTVKEEVKVGAFKEDHTNISLSAIKGLGGLFINRALKDIRETRNFLAYRTRDLRTIAYHELAKDQTAEYSAIQQVCVGHRERI